MAAPRKKPAAGPEWHAQLLKVAAVVVAVGVLWGAFQAVSYWIEGAEIAHESEPIVQRVPGVEQRTEEQQQILQSVSEAIKQIGEAAESDRRSKAEEKRAREAQEAHLRGLCLTGSLSVDYCRGRGFPTAEPK